MKIELFHLSVNIVKTLVICPTVGWTISISIYKILEALEIPHSTKGKRKCWLYSTIIVFALGVGAASFV